MSKIIKLDKNLANQIAAGEVVERPVSVIKELLENSIDAGATNIVVEIENGGMDKISITDNGEGIQKEDIPLVIEKYSTSKIKNLEDLYNIMTFGFRGEAVASISSVSDMKIVSKYINEDFGTYLSVIAGDIGEMTDYASDTGTKIIVENLFYNTPARLNYLKTARTEYNHIYGFLQEISLSYPDVGFEFISDGKQVFKYKSGEDLKTRIYNIYGTEFSQNLLKLDFSMNGISISGYISDPKVSFSNKNRQSLFVNKRVIKSSLIFKAINDAYNRFIPHNMSPAYVLNLTVDPTQVDVNVHPRKLEVRFASEQNIFRAVYHAIQDKLEKVSLLHTGGDKNLSASIDNFTQSSHNFSENKNDTGINNFNSLYTKNTNTGYTGSGNKFKSYSPYTDKSASINQSQIHQALNFSKEILSGKSIGDIENEEVFEKSSDLHDTPVGRIIGQAHNSYIIVETNEGIKFLDQHALAERIIYEKLVNNDTGHNVQGLLIGESMALTPKELDILEVNIDSFIDMGFDIQIMPGNIVIINAVPDFIKKENISKVFMGILDDIGSHNFSKSKTLDEVKNKIWAYTACRSAIKFGHKLNLFEMNKLLNDSVMDYSSTCPHGRPVVFDINLQELKDKYER
ncbi:MAG: DNA mismatch repair endonuclease MutL [Candidatus Gracilibacteria bacterium]|nr:DNA mismatch repair endonuclease MutL [Candidatus Gracilibacteria bacterium]